MATAASRCCRPFVAAAAPQISRRQAAVPMAPQQLQLRQCCQQRRERAAALVTAAGFGFGKAAEKKLSKQKACPCGSGAAFKVSARWWPAGPASCSSCMHACGARPSPSLAPDAVTPQPPSACLAQPLVLQECCQRYHEGALPETPEQLMRSRYSAYVKANWRYVEVRACLDEACNGRGLLSAAALAAPHPRRAPGRYWPCMLRCTPLPGRLTSSCVHGPCLRP